MGESILIPVEQIEWFKNMPPKILDKLVQGVMIGQSLAIGVKSGDGHFDTTSITNKEKNLF